MQKIDDQPVYSATDLVGFLACEHLTELDRAALLDLVERPVGDDLELDVLRRRGEQHEQKYLAELAAEGRSVVTITRDASPELTPGEQLRAAADETRRAMEAGADVIYQATFFDGRWRGHADFLLRVPSPERESLLGPYHYEVADTKLARHVKAGAVLQICVYTDLLTAVQGLEPAWLHVVLGGSAGGKRSLRVADYMAYYRSVKARFDAAVGDAAPPAAYPSAHTYPDPVEHCEVCRWAVLCKQRRRDDDHLSLVAGISRRQRQGFVGRGVETLAALAVLPLPLVPSLDGSSASAVERVRDQARIQLTGRERNAVISEFLDLENVPEPGTGLAGLPPPSPGDLFFDIEGDPFAADDGLDYLFGVMDVDGTWHALWSRDPTSEFNLDGEKAAFEAVVDLFSARMWTYPEAHIYHFAPYEPTALKRLMGRHATRENEVDRLLRGGALVDLHRVVKQSIRASVESYGIKSLEPLYGFTREIDLRDAGSSIVAFEQWLQLGEGERPAADHLARIEAYNRDDVVSNRRLRDWLEERRDELAEVLGSPIPRPGPRDPEPSPGLNERQQEVADLAERLAGDVPEEGRTPDQQARWLLAQLLSWHRREKKSAWWLFFHLKDEMTDAERIEAGEPIAGLEYVGVVDQPKQSLVHRYRFPLQDYDIKVGTNVVDPATWGKGQGNPGEVVALDQAARTIDLKRSRKSVAPHPTSLVPFDDYTTPEQEKALLRLGRWVAASGLENDGPHRAALDLLQARPARVGQAEGDVLRRPGEADLEAARRLAIALDRSTLAIQGPPGSGKTFGGARMALDLVRAGKRVGVTATSHKVISNFLAKLLEAAKEERTPVSIIQKAGGEPTGIEHPSYQLAGENDDVRDALASRAASVGAGTTWLWAREEMAGSVDVLFVDEAGQMSLANVLSAAGCAESLVLLGDPQQLDQPLQGSHPPGADRSALAHMVGDEAATIDDRFGLFLETTWRLHPDVCDYTSEVFYDGRLEPRPGLENQALHGPIPTDGTGLRLLTVEHAGNDHDSVEEADVVARLARALVEGSATWTDDEGDVEPIGWDKVVIVAAYNAQVGLIKERLPEEARVGTVDKFQGQEAPISIYSMASSSAEDAPRGMAFLYSRHRLNVATSRARCVTTIVASPELFKARARTPDQMRLANAFARFAELAKG